MAGITNGYADLLEVKSRIENIGSSTAYDSQLEKVIEAVSRWIDRNRRREFYTTSNEARYFTPYSTDMVVIDDLITITSLITDENLDSTYSRTWTASDYNLVPYNAASYNEPYTAIEVAPGGDYSFPVSPKSVKVTGTTWGYASTTPPAIKEACILATIKLWRRKDAIFGVAGGGDLGTITSIARLDNDPDVMALVSSIPRRGNRDY